MNRIVPPIIRNGLPARPRIGIQARSEALAARLNVDRVIVVEAAPDGPADEVGTDRVEPSHGDTIVAGNGKTGPTVGELFDAFDGDGVGKWVKLEVVRDGQRRKI